MAYLKKGNDWSAKFMAKSPFKKKKELTRWEKIKKAVKDQFTPMVPVKGSNLSNRTGKGGKTLGPPK